jgi:hypothetical protein
MRLCILSAHLLFVFVCDRESMRVCAYAYAVCIYMYAYVH